VGYQAGSSLDWGDADTPMFLRSAARSVDHINLRYRSDSEGYAGLSPLGLSEWLRNTPVAEWPKTYSELRQIGLGAWVVDWLELTMSTREDRALPEQTVVGAFLYVMSQRDTHESLAKSVGLIHGFKATVQRLKGLFTSDANDARPSVDVRLVEEMMVVLDDMTANKWPDRVYALGAAVNEVIDVREPASII